MHAHEYPELFADMAECIARFIMDMRIDGMTDEAAAATGHAAAEHVREHWTGERLYLPKGRLYDLSRRDADIWAKFNGRNFSALGKEYGLTEMRIRQIVARVRKSIKEEQAQLF